MSQGTFDSGEAWDAFTALLDSQLDGVDVQEISSKDFSENGELIMQPPSVRSLYEGAAARSTSDTQRLSYNVVGRFIALCADENLRDPAAQAKASLAIACKVKAVMIGARLELKSGDVSEPVTWIGDDVLPVEDVGVAYAVAFEVPGLAQFPGPNANQDGGDDR